ncbi:hypothetical protein ACFFR3_35080 [Nonomuraea salmonea]|uniref:Uncharacterized protein n=1 Tax=Nonomuraea salmonea TaxID=46181 RepID=A0ABV5NWQ2_9ACTN
MVADLTPLEEAVQAAEQAVVVAEHNRTNATRQLVVASDELRSATTVLTIAQASLIQEQARSAYTVEEEAAKRAKAELSMANKAYMAAVSAVDRAQAIHVRMANDLTRADTRCRRAKSRLSAAQKQVAEADAVRSALAGVAGGETPRTAPADNVAAAIRGFAQSHQPSRAATTSNPPELPFGPPRDLPGHDLKPDPLSARTPAEFVGLMKRYRIWAGEPSFRELVKRSRKAFGASTLCKALKSDQLPPEKLVRAFIWACSGSENDLQEWATTWRLLRMRHHPSPGRGVGSDLDIA